jgi:hypothetical protein
MAKLAYYHRTTGIRLNHENSNKISWDYPFNAVFLLFRRTVNSNRPMLDCSGDKNCTINKVLLPVLIPCYVYK